MRYRNIIIFIIALVLLVVAVFSLSEDILSPYVSFKEAMERPGKYVQVIGKLNKTVPIAHREGEYGFALIDNDGTKMSAIHRGTKPQNFEHTEQVVILGRYNADSNLFEADKVLVKCPSKYRGKQ